MRRTTKMTGSVHVTMPVLEQFEFVSTFGQGRFLCHPLAAFLLGLNGSVFEFYHTTLLHGAS